MRVPRRVSSPYIVVPGSSLCQLVAVALAAVLGFLSVPLPGLAAEAIVRIDDGTIRGSIENEIAVYRGIPYSAPPVGELRWRAPRAVVPWQGTLLAERFGPDCPQTIERRDAPGPSTDEDCLTLNVWAPVDIPETLHPVMLWIHGGSFKHGSGSRPSYDGTLLARQGVVVVTLNYRLGHLGVFGHPEMSSQQAGEPLGNYGVMDQLAALKWIQSNIAQFGGDPDKVTAFGYSAGGKSVLALMVSPLAEGLFHRAIVQSGGIRIAQVTQHLSTTLPGHPSLESEGEAMAAYFNLEQSDDVVAALRDLDADTILDYANRNGPPGTRSPVVDGRLVPAEIVRLFEAGRQQDMPLLIGSNSWEGSILSARSPSAARQSIKRLLGDQDEEQLRKLYGSLDIDAIIAGPWFSDWAFMTSARYLARQMQHVSSPAWLYRFDYVEEDRRTDVPGAAHGAEVSYVFQTLAQPISGMPVGAFTARDRLISEIVSAYWVRFASKGNPNAPGLPHWAPYDERSDSLLYIGTTIETRRKYGSASLDYHERRERNGARPHRGE